MVFSGFKSSLGTINVPKALDDPGTDSKTFAKSSIFGALNPVATFAFKAKFFEVLCVIPNVPLYVKLP